jgi:hypothetical protein
LIQKLCCLGVASSSPSVKQMPTSKRIAACTAGFNGHNARQICTHKNCSYAFYKFGRIFVGTAIIAIMVTIVAICHLSTEMRGQDELAASDSMPMPSDKMTHSIRQKYLHVTFAAGRQMWVWTTRQIQIFNM